MQVEVANFAIKLALNSYVEIYDTFQPILIIQCTLHYILCLYKRVYLKHANPNEQPCVVIQKEEVYLWHKLNTQLLNDPLK